MTGIGRKDGETAFIARYLAPLAAGYEGAFALQDDCAVLHPPAGSDLVVTVDAIAAGVHFFADDTPDDVAWKALAVNVSDLLAKGATPFAYVMSLAFPDVPDTAWMSAFSVGLQKAQASFGMHLAGGDTDRRPGPLSITITAFGLTPQDSFVRRSGGHAGDLLFVSGTVGDSGLGLDLRRNERDPGSCAALKEALSETCHAHLISRYLRPAPPLALATALRRYARAAIDISDGLVKDTTHLASASRTGAQIHLSSLPLSEAATAAVASGLASRERIAVAGGDYEVIAAVAPEDAEAFISAAAEAGVTVTAFGQLTSGADIEVLDDSGRRLAIAATGYDHFSGDGT